MSEIYPIIKSISALDWDGSPSISTDPLSFDCQLEIGADDQETVDYFTLKVVNRVWGQARPEQAPVPELEPAWLQPRAILMSDVPSFQKVIDTITREIDSMGPYASWPEFAKTLGPYLRWNLEGVPYPPFE